MPQPFQVSLDSSATDVFAPSYQIEAALVKATLATAASVAAAVPAIQDTVTLSAQAVNSSSSSNLLPFTTTAENSVRAQVNAQAVFASEYPLQHLLDLGYSQSEIANLFGLPTEASSTAPGVHTFDTAA